jgi:hypothetical protein
MVIQSQSRSVLGRTSALLGASDGLAIAMATAALKE